MNQNTRLSLLEEVQSDHSQEAWAQFSAIYGELISIWLSREGLQQADIDDLKQEVLSTLVREIDAFHHNGRVGAFRCWLRRIVSNRVNRLWQKKSREQKNVSPVNLEQMALQLEDDSSRLSLVWDQFHNEFVLHRLLRQIRPRFSETHMQAFEKISIEGKCVATVASELGMTTGAVRVAQHRILKALREIAGVMAD